MNRSIDFHQAQLRFLRNNGGLPDVQIDKILKMNELFFEPKFRIIYLKRCSSDYLSAKHNFTQVQIIVCSS